MAVRKTSVRKTRRSPRKKTSRNAGRTPASMIFLLFLIIVLVITFLVLLPRVTKNLSKTPTTTEQVEPQETPKPPAPERTVQPEKPPAAKPTEKPPEKPVAEKPAEKPPTPTTPVQDKPATPVAKPPEPAPSQPKPQQPAAQSTPPAAKPPETRDRTVYFMQESGGADLLLIKTNRKIAVSDSPLIDAINALLIGPNADEKRRGLVSFVPQGTRLLSARVNGNTVFLNFNEDFRYNTFGREGCEAQLKQIVWTATEFPNVNNVQFQIDGSIVDFLTEGIVIRNPIGR